MADVFISYARVDKDFVRKLHRGLEEINRDIWIDWEDIQPTAQWRKELYASIAAADNFLFIISPSSCASEMCREELAYAEANHKRLVPVVYRPVPHRDLPPALASIQWISFSDNPFESAFHSLVEAIDTDLEWVREHTRLLVRAREWEARNRDASLLLRGKDLLDAQRWQSQAAERQPKPVELQTQFLFVSHEAQRRRQRFVLGGVTAALVLTAALAIFAIWEWRQATIERNQAVSRQLAAESTAGSATNLGTALRDAVAAAEAARTSEAEIALNAALENPRERFILHHNGWRFDETIGHQRELISAAAFSPDGSRVVTASGDQTARVWDARSGRLLFTFEHHGEVRDAEFSPDGKRIVTASDDNTAQVWDAGNGNRLATLQHPDLVLSATFSPDGERIVTAGWDGTARVWDAANGRLLTHFSADPNMINSAVFSPDGKQIATAGNDMMAQVWDAESGKCLATLAGHTGWVHSANFSPDGTRIVTASNDMTARIWDARSGRSLATLSGHLGQVNSAVFSPDGYRIVTAGVDSTARVWDAANGQLLAMLTGHTGPVYSAVFSADSSRIVTASDDHTARLWNAQNRSAAGIARRPQ